MRQAETRNSLDSLLRDLADQPGSTLVTNVLRAAREHLDMQVAFVSEFRDGRQVVRTTEGAAASFGLQPGRGVPLEETYCSRVVSGLLPNIIPDAQHDPRVADLKATREAAIGSYVSVPIRLSDGRLFGTLCCLSHDRNHELGSRDVRFLEAFGQVIGLELERENESARQRREQVERIRRVIKGEGLCTVYQPIFDLRGERMVGVEALSRFEGTTTVSPLGWFLEAASVGLSVELDMAAAGSALREIGELDDGLFMAVNLSPQALLSRKVLELARRLPPGRLVVEITEHARVDDYVGLQDALLDHRRLGIQLAVDDAGAGFASFQHILRLQPDLIKLDATLVRDVHRDPVRRSLAHSLVTFARDLSARVIAEGVERREEADTLKELGVDYAQGYYLAKPGLMPARA